MAAFEAYRQHRTEWFQRSLNDPWRAEYKAHEALHALDALARCRPLITALAGLDIRLPKMHHARVVNWDGKGTTEMLLFYPSDEPDSPLVSIATRDLHASGETQTPFSVALYDPKYDALVEEEANLGHILDEPLAHPPIPLRHEVAHIPALVYYLCANEKPQPPAYQPPPSGQGSCAVM